MDNTVLPKGVSYYRLRQVDFDGRATYSEIKAVRTGNGAIILSVYPNPSRGTVNVAIPDGIGTFDVSVDDFTGIGYFFAKELVDSLKIPVGLINASWGGSNIETWISREGFESSEEFKSLISTLPKTNLDSLLTSKISVTQKRIEKLQNEYNKLFQSKVPEDVFKKSIKYGEEIAKAIYIYSKTDGGHEAYNNTTSASYIPPTGPGMWVPTPPAFGKPLHPYWGNNRSFIKNIVTETQPAAPVAFSTQKGSKLTLSRETP